MAAPQDPNRIDVSLNIISDAALVAVNNLSQQLSGLHDLIASQGSMNPAAQAQAAGRAVAYVQPGGVQSGIYHGTTAPIVAADPSNPSQGAQTSRQQRDALRAEYMAYMKDIRAGVPPSGGDLSPAAEQMMMHQISDIQRMRLALGEKKQGAVGSAVDRFLELYPGVRRDPNEDRTFERVSGGSAGESALPEGVTTPSGVPSQGASLPGGGRVNYMGWGGGGGGPRPPAPPTGPPPDDFGGNTVGGGPSQTQPGWEQALGREGITPESRLGLTIPRLGEFTIQDKLNMYAQWMGRAAMRRQDALPPGTPTDSRTNFMGRTAAGAAYLRDQSAALVAVGQEFQRLRNFARGEELGGEQLGFSRESSLGDVEMLGAGMRLNLGVTSPAQQEAIHQEFTQRRVQAAAGVSGEEAQRIRQIVSGMGYSRDLNANLQMNLFRNLQQRGIAPEAVAPLVDQGVRQGNMSIAALRDTMYDLAEAARNANMTLEDVTSATLEYAEGVQATGANYEAALRNATTYTRMGLDPRIVGQAQQSPMMQGILTARTGLPPQLQGVIAAPEVSQAMGQAIQQGLALGSSFANMPDRTIRTASGQRITVATGRDAQIAMAAQTTGIPRQIIERYMDNPQFLETGSTAQTMVGRMQDQLRGITNEQREVRRFIPDPMSDEQREQSQIAARFGNTFSSRRERQTGHWVTEKENTTRGLTAAQRRALERGSSRDDVIQYNELEAQMIAMDPKNQEWTDRVRKIAKDHPKIEERLGHAQRIIGEATAVTPEPDYLVGLTDEARKILKIEKPKDRNAALPRANAGGAPANSAMQGPNFPSNTGGAFQYGRPGP